MMRLCLLAAVLAVVPLQDTVASTIVIAAPSTRYLQVVSANTSGGSLVGSLNLPPSLGSTVLSTAVAGEFAFTIVSDGVLDGSSSSNLAVTYVADSQPQLVANVSFPSFASTAFAGCYVAPGDLAAQTTGDLYDLYVYLECPAANGTRKAGNYVVKLTYSRSRDELSGPLPTDYYFLNTYDAKYKYVSILNAISVFGGNGAFQTNSSGQGTAYIVLTTTSATNGQTYKPALHILKNNMAVPLGILAKTPTVADASVRFGLPRFAIRDPTSFYSLFRQLCASPCAQPGFNGLDVVTLTTKGGGGSNIGAKTESWSLGPADLAYDKAQTLFRLEAGAYNGSGPDNLVSLTAVSTSTSSPSQSFVPVLEFSVASQGSQKEILELAVTI